MEFEWDEAKRRRLILDRDIDILEAAQIFDDPVGTLVWPDNRKGGEDRRYVAIDIVGETWYELAFALRGTAIRLITVWKLNEKTKRKAEAGHARRVKGYEGTR